MFPAMCSWLFATSSLLSPGYFHHPVSSSVRLDIYYSMLAGILLLLFALKQVKTILHPGGLFIVFVPLQFQFDTGCQ